MLKYIKKQEIIIGMKVVALKKKIMNFQQNGNIKILLLL